MPDWMSPFKTLASVLQKPQSIATGILGEVTGQSDDARRFIDQYEMALVDDTPENALRYKAALQAVGDSEPTDGGITNIGSILSGAARGVTSNVRPSDFLMAEGIDNGVATNAANIGIDPLMLLGGGGTLPKALQGTQAGKLLGAAGTFGKLGPEAGKAEKAAQIARRLYQGTMASGGDPLLAVGAAAGIGGVERGGAALLSKFGGKLADDLVGQGTEQALSRPGIETVNAQYEAALRALAQDMPEASRLTPGMGAQGPGFEIPQTRVAPGMELEPWQPGAVPPLNADPRVAAAREMIAGQAVTNPRQLNQSPLTFRGSVDANEVMGQLAKEYSVGPSRGGLRQREVYGPLDRQQVPFNDQGALFNQELLSQGMPVPSQIMPALPPGSSGNLPAPSPFAGVERLPEELLQRPVPFNAPMRPEVAMLEGMQADPAFLQRMANEFLGPQGSVLPGGRPVGAPVRDNRFLPAALREQAPEQAMDVLETVVPAARPKPMSDKQISILRQKALNGDKRAQAKLAALLEAEDESPLEAFLRLAGG